MKISIITVTYNSAATLRDTIESVLKQDYRDFEYLVIDGGSTDGTVDIIKEYEERFRKVGGERSEVGGERPEVGGERLEAGGEPVPSFRWISEPDKGMYDGINKGIRMATGDVVGIINSDDFFHRSDILGIINEAFEGSSNLQPSTFNLQPSTTDRIEAIYGDVRFVNPYNLNKTVRYYSCKNWRPWRFRFGFMPAHPTFYTYRENFEKYGYYQYDYKIAADYELLIRHLYTNKVRAKYVPVDFMKMRTGGKSTGGWRSNWVLNKEIVRGCKENGIWTCMPLLFLKYFVKVFELIFTKND